MEIEGVVSPDKRTRSKGARWQPRPAFGFQIKNHDSQVLAEGVSNYANLLVECNTTADMRKLQINLLWYLRNQIPLFRIEVETKYPAARKPRARIWNQLHECQEPAIEIEQMGGAKCVVRDDMVHLNPLVLVDVILDQDIIQRYRFARQKIHHAVTNGSLREGEPKVRQ